MSGAPLEFATTEYRGEPVLVGRYVFRVASGKLYFAELGGPLPQFTRPRGQPGTIAVNLDKGGKADLR